MCARVSVGSRGRSMVSLGLDQGASMKGEASGQWQRQEESREVIFS